jgi:serine/threonine protein kinase
MWVQTGTQRIVKRYLNWLRVDRENTEYHHEISATVILPTSHRSTHCAYGRRYCFGAMRSAGANVTLPQVQAAQYKKLLYQSINMLMTDAVTTKSAPVDNFQPEVLPSPTVNYSMIHLEKCGEIEDRNLAKRYLIQSLLSRGSFGITFLARNIYLPGNPLCVIKQFAPRCIDPQLIEIARKQFELEALILSRLGSHAQIPSLLDYFSVGANCYLVEEYLPGIVLSKLVTTDRQFTEVEVEKFLTQMLRVLEYIHSHHLIHQDIKPQNIILCQTDRRFVLLDFGAVKDIDPITAGKQGENSRAIGTLGFAPPEQLTNRPVYASDIYALGMTCIYLLTGTDPSEIPTDPQTCELLWAEGLEISVELIEIINKMTQILLVDRYQSATQVLTALDNRSIRAKLRAYLDQKHAIAKSENSGSLGYYPAVVHWALGIG